MVAGPSEYEHVLQCNNKPSSQTPRGHQFPAAFMIRSSGLDKVKIFHLHFTNDSIRYVTDTVSIPLYSIRHCLSFCLQEHTSK